MSRTCQGCKESMAVACDECRRALALKSFSGISRHPESIEPGDTPCHVCEDGPSSWCGECLVAQVAVYRRELREHAGRDIGRWPDYPAVRLMTQQSDAMMRMAQQLREGS